MLSSFNTALEKASEENRNELKIGWASDMLRICIAIHNLSWKHVNKFVAVQGQWQEHINRCERILGVLDIAYQWGGQQAIVQNEITIASNLIIGIKYQDFRNRPKAVFLNPASQQRMQARIDKAADEMRKFDSSYVTPKPKKVKIGLFS
jgi:hypothetical protein